MTHPVQKVLIAFALGLVQLGAGSSFAVPITWTLSGAIFDDGGTASGSFAYDASSNTLSDINITTTTGTSFGGASYHAPFAFNSSFMPLVPSLAPADFSGTPLLSLFYAPALTNAGGTVGLASSSSESTCTNADCSSSGTPLRSFLTAGSLSASLPVTYFLNVTFGDGGTASGSFVYDVLNNIYSGVDITTTAGSAFGGAHYGAAQGGSDASNFSFTGFNLTSITTIKFTVNTALDTPDLLGFDSLIIGQEEAKCPDATCSTSSPLREVTGGSVSSADVPAPSSLILGLAGGLALLAGRRRRQKYEDATR